MKDLKQKHFNVFYIFDCKDTKVNCDMEILRIQKLVITCKYYCHYNSAPKSTEYHFLYR